MNDSSKRLLAHKLIKEFEQQSAKYFGESQEHRFNFAQISEFLRLLRFISARQDASNPHFIHESTLVYDMWSLLKGDRFSGVNERNLLVLLLAIIGLNFPIPKYVKPAAETETVKTQKPVNTKIDNSANHSRFSTLNESTKLNTATQSHSKLANISNISDHHNNNSNSFDISHHILNGYSHAPEATLSNTSSSKGASNRNSQPSDLGIAGNILEDCSDILKTHVNLGTFDDTENISFTDQEVACIKQVYDTFYMNRSHSVSKTTQKDLSAPTTRKISKTSLRLAETYREKQLEDAAKFLVKTQQSPPNNGRLTHADLLICNRSAQKFKRIQEAEEYAQKQLESCSFTPKLSQKSKKMMSTTPNNRSCNNRLDSYGREISPSHSCTGKHQSTFSACLGIKRTEDLYSLGKEKQTKEDKSYAEWYDEKFIQECTFTPEINRSRKYSSRERSVDQINNATKSIERLRKGREIRDQAILQQSRGRPVNEIPADRLGSFNCGIDGFNNKKPGFEQHLNRTRSNNKRENRANYSQAQSNVQNWQYSVRDTRSSSKNAGSVDAFYYSNNQQQSSLFCHTYLTTIFSSSG